MRLGWVLIYLITATYCTGCPQFCNCTYKDGIKGAPPHTAHCNEMPHEPLPSTITYIKVNTSLKQITKEVMSNMGPHIQILDLSECGTRYIEPGAFSGLTNIVELRLSKNNIQLLHPHTFGGNSSIEILYLDGNNLTTFVETHFEDLVNLQELHLQENSLNYISNKLPKKLRLLDISTNNITQNATFFYQGNLKHLNLCGNPYTELDTSRSQPTILESLCLGDHSITLPEHTADYLPNLHIFSLIAKSEARASLDNQTQNEIGHMTKLDKLTIVHYMMDTLDFLQHLTKIKILCLQYISAKKGINVDRLFSNMHSLSRLYLDGSTTLANTILGSDRATFSLRELHYLGLRETGLKYYLPFHVPYKSFFKLDISNNPLQCDCTLMKLQSALDSELSHHLYQPERTLCNLPPEAHGQPLLQYMHSLQCSITTPPTSKISGNASPESTETDYTTLYIVLGVIIAILAIAGVSLGIIYRRYKQRSQLFPREEPQEPTFQQLQQSRSEDALIKK